MASTALWLLFLGLTTLPWHTYAFSVADVHTLGLCDVFLTCASVPGIAGAAAYIVTIIIPIIEIGFVAVGAVILFLATMSMVMHSNDDSAVTEGRKSFYYVVAGGAVIGLSHLIVGTFQVGNGVDLVNQAPYDKGVSVIITYFKLIIAVALIANIVIQAFRLITSQGDEGQTEKARKRVVNGFVGVGFVLLATPLMAAVGLPKGGSSLITVQIIGIANFLLALIGILSIIAILVSGLMMLFSIQESLKDKARSGIVTAITALVVVLVSYALLNTFVGVRITPT